MLHIRDKQLQELGIALAIDAFMDEMLVHLQRFAPKHASMLQPAGLASLIRFGIERARRHGWVQRGPCRLYLEHMFMFGSYFDDDPLLPWVRQALQDDGLPNQLARARQLHQDTLDYLKTVAGPKRIYAIDAMRYLKHLASEQLPDDVVKLEPRVVDLFHKAYPQRFEYLGAERLHQLFHRAIERSEQIGLQTCRGVTLTSVLLFIAGEGFHHDPLFPWIGATLQNPAFTSVERRVERLEARSLIYLDRALRYLDERTDRV